MGCKYDGNDYNWHEKVGGKEMIYAHTCFPDGTDEAKSQTLAKFDGLTVDEKGHVAKDIVNHPSHYTDGKIEVIDYIEDKKLNYHLGNAVKYISRAGKKDPDKHIEDIQKAVWYLNREIERVSR